MNRLLVAAASVCFLVTACTGGRSRGPSSLSKMGQVERTTLIQKVTIAGKVIPNRSTVITAPYDGYIRKLHVKIGDRVKKNSPVVSLTQTLYGREESFPIRSPFSGVVVQVPKSEGEYVKKGDEKKFILRIDDTSTLYVDANVPEIDVGKLRKGQEVVLNASAILGESFRGRITEISLASRGKESWSNQVEFPVRVEVLDKDPRLKPGMSTIVDVIAAKKENILTLRHEFLQKEGDKYFVVLEEGEKRPIQVGIYNEEKYEILDGIEEGTRVKQTDFFEVYKKNNG